MKEPTYFVVFRLEEYMLEAFVEAYTKELISYVRMQIIEATDGKEKYKAKLTYTYQPHLFERIFRFAIMYLEEIQTIRKEV